MHIAPRRFVISGLAVAALLVSGVSAQLPLGLMTFNIRTASIDDGENAWPNRKALVNEAGRYPSDHFPVAARIEISLTS